MSTDSQPNSRQIGRSLGKLNSLHAHRTWSLRDGTTSEALKRIDLPDVSPAVVSHAPFETIHPFGDGNGRVGPRCHGAATQPFVFGQGLPQGVNALRRGRYEKGVQQDSEGPKRFGDHIVDQEAPELRIGR